MSKKIKFSIITPTLNSEKYIHDCLLSVHSQAEIDFEHILVDGGSRDKTVDIIKNYSHAVLYNLPESNIYEALNFGIQKSTGDIICFLNSDDYYISSHTLSNVSKKFEISNFEIAYGGCIMVNENKVFLYHCNPLKRVRFFVGSILVYFAPHPGTFFRRDVFLKYGLYNTTYRYSSDCEYLLRCLKSDARFQNLHFFIAYFRRHNSNASSNLRAKLDIRLILKKYQPFCPYIMHKLIFLIYNLGNLNYMKFLIRRFFLKFH